METTNTTPRGCMRCGNLITADRRADARYCSAACRQKSFRLSRPIGHRDSRSRFRETARAAHSTCTVCGMSIERRAFVSPNDHDPSPLAATVRCGRCHRTRMTPERVARLRAQREAREASLADPVRLYINERRQPSTQGLTSLLSYNDPRVALRADFAVFNRWWHGEACGDPARLYDADVDDDSGTVS